MPRRNGKRKWYGGFEASFVLVGEFSQSTTSATYVESWNRLHLSSRGDLLPTASFFPISSNLPSTLQQTTFDPAILLALSSPYRSNSSDARYLIPETPLLISLLDCWRPATPQGWVPLQDIECADFEALQPNLASSSSERVMIRDY
jgi:hypothetical protein